MKDERYKEIMAQVGMPDSQSLLIALKQVVNEVGQKYTKENAELRAQLVEIIETHNAQAIRAEEYAGICAENALLRAQLAEMEKEIILRTAETRNEAKENILLMEKLKEHDNNAEILRCAKEQAKLGNIVTDKLAPYIIACGETCAAVRAREGYNK